MDKSNTYQQQQPAKQERKKPKAVEQVLTKSHLQNLVITANKIKAIEDYIKTTIAPEWSTYYHVQNLNGNTLIIACVNSSVAQKIRMNSMDWLYNLRQAHWPGLSAVKVKVNHEGQPGLPDRFKQVKVERSASADTLQTMENLAQTMPDDLQQAWLELMHSLQTSKS